MRKGFAVKNKVSKNKKEKKSLQCKLENGILPHIPEGCFCHQVFSHFHELFFRLRSAGEIRQTVEQNLLEMTDDSPLMTYKRKVASQVLLYGT